MRLLPFLLLGCPSAEPTATSTPAAVCDAPTPLPCDLAADLPQNDAVSDGLITTQVDGNDWIQTLDARAGGFLAAADNPWLYVRFGDDGLEKVELTDLEAQTSMDWDLAVHRFNLRLNSGSSGPSCVTGGPATGTYEALDLEQAIATPTAAEAFYDGTCTFLTEDTGEEGAPDGIPTLALQDWWTYPHCVATSGIPLVIQVADGRRLKLEMLGYYGGGQDLCNTEGQAGQDAAMLSLKWTWLQ